MLSPRYAQGKRERVFGKINIDVNLIKKILNNMKSRIRANSFLE